MIPLRSRGNYEHRNRAVTGSKLQNSWPVSANARRQLQLDGWLVPVLSVCSSATMKPRSYWTKRVIIFLMLSGGWHNGAGWRELVAAGQKRRNSQRDCVNAALGTRQAG